MSITGLFASLLPPFGSGAIQNQRQLLQQQFQQLGTDLASGNLSAAQSDFATLQKDSPFVAASVNQANSSSNSAGTSASTSGSSAAGTSAQSTNPIAQAFSQLAQDLQSGNLSAAQSDFSTLQQDVQSAQSAQTPHHHHRHHGGSGENSQNSLSQLFGQLGQELQAGNLTTAQQTYTSLAQEFEAFGLGNGSVGAANSDTATPGTSGVSVNA